MILRVTQVQVVLVLPEYMTDSLWMMELRLVVTSIDKANLTVANLILKLHRVFVDDDQPVVGSVRNND